MPVRKRGVGTSPPQQDGRVRCPETIVCVKYRKKVVLRLEHQVLIDRDDQKPFCGHGDSGALVVASQKSVPVGLVFAVNTKVTEIRSGTVIKNACFANPIRPVLERFGVEIDGEHGDSAGECRIEPHGAER